MDPGSGVPPAEPTVPGARSSGVAAREGDAAADAAAGNGVVVRAAGSDASSVSSGSSSRPRGKGRPGRIDSIADAWTDRRQRSAGRSLPLPAPPKVALGTHSDVSITGVGAEPEEDDDDFTVVDPDKSPRSFESGATSAIGADRTGTSRIVDGEIVSPILTGHRSRRIWTAAVVALGATGVVSALVYTALGGGPRREDGTSGEGAILSAEAQAPRPLFDTVPVAALSIEPPAPQPAVADAPKLAGQAKVAAGSQVAAAPQTGAAGVSSDPRTRRAPPSPAAPSTGRAPSSPASAPAPSTRPARPLGTAPVGPRVAAAPESSGVADARDEPGRRTRPPPARKPSRPEPAPVANPDDLYRDGARLYLDGKFEEARRKFQTAIDTAPRFAPAHRGLGLVYERMGHTGRAIRSWQAYLRIAPGAADAELVRARIERLSR
jgi:TolA-binding protein